MLLKAGTEIFKVSLIAQNPFFFNCIKSKEVEKDFIFARNVMEG